jgi:LPXTG-motif cell wall-anchored protein
VLLKAGDQTIQTATLNEENNWQYTFTGIDKYDSDGEVIEYKVEEEPLDGYTAEISGNPEGYTITNTSTETLDIPVEKKWVGPAADSVTIRLLANGQEKESIVLSEEGEWKHIFNDLPKYDRNDGHEIEYTISEDDITGYSSKVEGSAENGYTVTNTEEKTPEKTPEITPEKTQKNTTKKTTKKTTRSSSSTRKTKSGNSPGTGDETNIAIWLGILLVSASILFFILRRQKKKKDTK